MGEAELKYKLLVSDQQRRQQRRIVGEERQQWRNGISRWSGDQQRHQKPNTHSWPPKKLFRLVLSPGWLFIMGDIITFELLFFITPVIEVVSCFRSFAA